MSYLFTPKRKSRFNFSLWLRWIISSLVGWSSLFGSIIFIFYYANNLYIFPMFFIGIVIIGLIQWVNIRKMFSWSRLWVRANFVGIPLGLIYVIVLTVIIGPAGLGVGLVINSFFGVVGGIIAITITVSFCFVIITHYNGKLTKRVTARVNQNKLLFLEQIVIIKDATSAAIILNAIFLFLDVFVGIIIGGFTFALLTGFGVNEIGVPIMGPIIDKTKPKAKL